MQRLAGTKALALLVRLARALPFRRTTRATPLSTPGTEHELLLLVVLPAGHPFGHLNHDPWYHAILEFADIFGSIAFDHARIYERLQELAWLTPQLRIYFQERRLPARGGLGGWALEHARARGEVQAAFAITQIIGDVRVDLALAWNELGASVTRAFVNTCEAPCGTHVDALWSAFATYARSIEAAASRRSTVREALERGFTSIIHVGLFGPAFAGATRERLTSPEAGRAVTRAIAAWLASTHAWCARGFLDQRLGSAAALRER